MSDHKSLLLDVNLNKYKNNSIICQSAAYKRIISSKKPKDIYKYKQDIIQHIETKEFNDKFQELKSKLD